MFVFTDFLSISHRQCRVTNPVVFRVGNLRLQTLFDLRDFSTISHKQPEVTNPMFVFSDFSSISHRQSGVTKPVRFP